MSDYTLDQIRAAAEAKYGNLNITLEDDFVATLLNPLRLSKTKRDELTRLQRSLKAEGDEDSTEDVDQEQVLRDILKVVAENVTAGNKLNKALRDLTEVAAVFESYSEVTQAGEASASQD
jgi:uncharacterized coiled-coil protein SlyX